VGCLRVLRSGCSILEGIEVSFLLPGCLLLEWGFFLCAPRLWRFLVQYFQACTFSCSFLPIALDTSSHPRVSVRVRGFLAGEGRDGLLLEVVSHIPRGDQALVPS